MEVFVTTDRLLSARRICRGIIERSWNMVQKM